MNKLNPQTIPTLANFSLALGHSLVRTCHYQQHPKQAELVQVIALLDDALKQGHSQLPITFIEQQLQLDSLAEKVTLFSQLIGNETQHTPIVYFNHSLALRRPFDTEVKITNFIKQKQSYILPTPQALNKVDCDQLDPWQTLAAIVASSFSFSIITGGAGTGKTTTLAKALEFLYQRQPNAKIILAAPTGKAAKHLQQSIYQQATNPNIERETTNRLQLLEVRTIHQILGISQTSGVPYYNQHHPLLCDFLAIDESSMLGNDTFIHIINALLPQAQLVLLGDEQQLPAINTPAFFNIISQQIPSFNKEFIQQINTLNNIDLPDLTTNKQQHQQAIVKLKKSFRFNEKSIIYQYANSVLTGNSHALVKQLKTNQALQALDEHYLKHILSQFPKEKNALLAYLEQHIILCAKRQGSFSSEQINAYLDNELRNRLNQEKSQYSEFPHHQWYLGRRVMIEKNEYSLNVFNGDIGQCVLNERNEMVIDFGHTVLDIKQLPKQTSLAYAISIHKSQGSEYESVTIILDKQQNSLLNRSLLYTAITRAKTNLSIFGHQDILHYSIAMNQQNYNHLEVLLKS